MQVIKDGYTLSYVTDTYAIVTYFINGKLQQYRINAQAQ